MFISPEKQVALVREWNKIFGWDFTENDFVKISTSIPEWPQKALCAVVLDITFEEKNFKSSRQTLWKNWELLRWLHNGEQDRIKNFHIGGIELLPEITKVPGLHWSVVDFAANLDIYSGKCNHEKIPKLKKTKKVASSEVLWAIAYFPEWADMLGNKLYGIGIVGYKFFDNQEIITVDSGRTLSGDRRLNITSTTSLYHKIYIPEVIS